MSAGEMKIIYIIICLAAIVGGLYTGGSLTGMILIALAGMIIIRRRQARSSAQQPPTEDDHPEV